MVQGTDISSQEVLCEVHFYLAQFYLAQQAQILALETLIQRWLASRSLVKAFLQDVMHIVSTVNIPVTPWNLKWVLLAHQIPSLNLSEIFLCLLSITRWLSLL